MNLSDCPAFDDALKEVVTMAKRIAGMPRSKNISRWEQANWSISLTLAVGGIVLAPVSGGLSLIASLLGIVWLLIDMLKKIRATSNCAAQQEEADGLLDRMNFLEWCLTQRRQ